MNSFSHPLRASVFTTVWPRLRRGDETIRWHVLAKTAPPEQPLPTIGLMLLAIVRCSYQAHCS